MDFEIEEEPSDLLAGKWGGGKSKSKGGGGYFGAVGGFGGGRKASEDIYDYDFDGGAMGDFEISHYSSPPEKSTKSSAVKSQPQQQSKTKAATTATAAGPGSQQMSAMEKAQSMLNKYSGKGSVASGKQPIGGNKSRFSSEYNEDDISIGSDELSASGGFMESPMPPKSSSKPQLTKESVKTNPKEPVKQQLSRGFDLEDDDEADELVTPSFPLAESNVTGE